MICKIIMILNGLITVVGIIFIYFLLFFWIRFPLLLGIPIYLYKVQFIIVSFPSMPLNVSYDFFAIVTC